MFTAIIVIASLPAVMVAAATVVAIPITLLEMWSDWSDRRKKQKELDNQIRIWTAIAEDSDGILKGYAVAMICCYEMERK